MRPEVISNKHATASSPKAAGPGCVARGQSQRPGSISGVGVAAVTVTVAAAALAGCATVGAGPPSGSEEKPTEAETSAIQALGAQAKGRIVWSSSRVGNHDLFVMNTDGSDLRQITKGDNVDWFPRFSPDGTRILFTRSKKGWVFERDANAEGKWDIFSMASEGGDEKKLVENASWGSWIGGDEIVYARATRIYRRGVGASANEETLLVDSTKVPDLDGALVQQPEMSKDGKYIAITLRGSKRETGIWDLEKKTWTRTGEGCQINWTPSGDEIYWVHPTGNGGSRVLHMPVDGGKPSKSDSDIDALQLVDIPGRRSHEYFPQLSRDGQWLVWAATQRGHDHDVADYELYLWKVGEPAETATRLTYHSGNDRWPDIFIAGAGATARSSSDTKSGTAEGGADSENIKATSAVSPGDADSDADEPTSTGKGKGKGHKSKQKKSKR